MCHRLTSVLLLTAAIVWAADQRPSVVLISVDTLRADRLSCYGSRGVRTPNIDAIANGGTKFNHVLCQVPLTLPSHVSLLTSTYPFFNGVRDNGQTLRAGAVTLATILKAQGYRTAAFVASFVLDRRFGLSQGFAEYNGSFDLGGPHGTDPGNVKRFGEDVVQDATTWLSQNMQQPFLLFLHLYDLHTPYRIPGRGGRPTYETALAYEDRVIGRFWEFLVKTGILDHTLVFFISDHGEGLGDHGESTHGYFVYQSTLQVPMLIHWPGGNAFPHTVDQIAGLIDVAPTIADYLGVPRPEGFQGHSLMGVLHGRGEKRDIYSESLYAQNHFGCTALLALTDDRYKFIDSSQPELYDTTRDPAEQNNLYPAQKALTDTYRARTNTLTNRYSSSAAGGSQQPRSDAVGRLRSLGYLGGTSTLAKATRSGPAPAERIAAWESYGHALQLASSGKVAEAQQVMQQLLAKTPDLADVHLSLGLLYQTQGRHVDAATEFRQLLRLDPANAVGHFNLGISLETSGQAEAAAKEFEAALALDPNYTRAEEMLAGQLLQRRMFAEARVHYEHILKVDPSDFGAHYNLGVLAASHQNWMDAKQHLEAALIVKPASADARNVLGGICLRQGDLSSARRHLEEALRLSPKMSMAHYNLGLVLRKEGDNTGALREFRLALQFDPQNQAAREAVNAGR